LLFPLQQWLRERATILRYMYIAYIFSVCPPALVKEIFFSCLIHEDKQEGGVKV
jgi:hypothetical protein